MMRFEHVCVTYRAATGPVAALSDVSLDVLPGERVVLLGANGSGKSTLARLSNGLMLPDNGIVTVDGVPTTDAEKTMGLRESVGMVFQHPDDQIVGTSVEDDVAFGPENLGLAREEIRRRVDDAIAMCGLVGLAQREPHLLSGGQKQRLAIAGALAMNPRYLVLDEPTSMLDSSGREAVADILRESVARGCGVLHITHDVAEAEGADRVLVLEQGRAVFEGSPRELVSQGARLADWGLEMPPIAVLAQALRGAGLGMDAAILGVDAMLEALWR